MTTRRVNDDSLYFYDNYSFKMQILPSRSLVSLSYPFKDDRVAAGCHAIHQVLTGVWPSLWWGTPVICKPPNERRTWAPGARRGLPAWLTLMQTGSNVLLHSRWRMTDLTHYGGVSLVIWIHLRSRLRNYLRKTFYNPRSLQSLVWQIVCLCWSCVLFTISCFLPCWILCSNWVCRYLYVKPVPKLYSDHRYTCHGGVG